MREGGGGWKGRNGVRGGVRGKGKRWGEGRRGGRRGGGVSTENFTKEWW